MFDALMLFVVVLGIAGAAVALRVLLSSTLEFAVVASRPLRRRVGAALQAWFGIRARARGLDARTVSRQDMLLLALEDIRLWVGLAALAALIAYNPTRSVAVFTLVAMGGAIYVASRRSYYGRKLNNDVENLIVQFASRYPVWRSVTRVLGDIYREMPEGELRAAMGQVVVRLETSEEISTAVASLAALKNPTLRQFTSALGAAQSTDNDVLQDIMRSLGDDVRNRSSLVGEIRQSLTILTITTRSLQVVFGTALLIATFAQTWQEYFSSSVENMVMLIAMSILALVASFYVEKEVEFLENV